MIIFGYAQRGISVTYLERNGDARELVRVIGQVPTPPCVDGLYRVVCTPAERRLVESCAYYEQLIQPVPEARVLDLRHDAGAFAILGGTALMCEQEAN